LNIIRPQWRAEISVANYGDSEKRVYKLSWSARTCALEIQTKPATPD
jgi:hypothetical protein